MASSLDIAPALGHGLLTAQGQPGGYDAIDDRRRWSVGRQEGAISIGAYKVTQKAEGANLSVDVATDQGGFLVQGDDVTAQGLYQVPPLSLKTNLTLASPPDPTNPRVDQVVLEARDDAHTHDGITRARVYVLTGTPTAGASVVDSSAYNASRATLPPSTARLAEFVVAAGASSITNANIRDRRTMALGLLAVQEGTKAGNYNQTSTTPTPAQGSIDVECSGAPLRLEWTGVVYHSVQNGVANISLLMDGVVVARQVAREGDALYEMPLSVVGFITPTPGRHSFQWALSTSGAAGTASVNNNGNSWPYLTLEERPGRSIQVF